MVDIQLRKTERPVYSEVTDSRVLCQFPYPDGETSIDRDAVLPNSGGGGVLTGDVLDVQWTKSFSLTSAAAPEPSSVRPMAQSIRSCEFTSIPIKPDSPSLAGLRQLAKITFTFDEASMYGIPYAPSRC
jgi:hypothetical protein